MSRLLDNLHFRARAAAPTWAVAFGLSAVLIIAYHLGTFELARADYPELRLTFLAFLRASARGDAYALLGLGLFTLLLLLAVAPSPRAQRAVAVGMCSLVGVFLSVAVNFFDVYESPLKRRFLESLTVPDLHGSFSSLAAELLPATVARTAAMLVVLLAITRFVLKRRAPAAAGASSRWRRVYAWLLPPMLLLGLGWVPVSPSRADRSEESELIADLSVNPVYGLVASGTPESAPAIAPARKPAPFTFRFDTASRTSKARYAGLPGLARGTKYNVIFYFIESTAAAYVDEERNGKPVTPVIKRLAKNAIVFKNHYADYPLSANAMLNVLTSAYDGPGQNPVVQELSHIGLTSLPEALKAGGYRTYLVHTGMLGYANQDKFLKVRGLDRIDDKPRIQEPPYTDWVGWGLDDRALIKPTLKFIGEDRARPFFAALFPVCPHHPYAIPDKSFSLGNIAADLPTHERVRLKYLDSLHYSDAVLGDLVDALEKSGAMQNTLLFVFADHGEAFYQHERNFNHPLFVYEENVHVPFLIYNKALFTEPQTYEGVSRHVDLMPTVLDLLGLPAQPLQEGISLASPHDEQLAISHTSYNDDLTSIRDGPWKYVVRSPDGREELYDLTADPTEKRNVASAHAEVAKVYREVAARWREHRDEYYRRVLRDYPMREVSPAAAPDAGGPADSGR